MSTKHLLALLAVVLWAVAGCASVLGVDSSDYGDAAGILCTCAEDPDNCAAEVEERVAADAELEQTALDCMAEDAACKAVAACVAEAGYCASFGKGCLSNVELNPLLACCAGLECGSGRKCCGGDGFACTGPGECCSGQCVDGACAAAPRECLDRGAACTLPAQCCSTTCTNRKCL